jgi:hypothetical protein
VDVQIQVFLTSAIVGAEWSASRPGPFTSGERAPDVHLIGEWLGPRTGLDDMDERKFLSLPELGSPATLSSSPQPIAIPIALSWLRIYGNNFNV